MDSSAFFLRITYLYPARNTSILRPMKRLLSQYLPSLIVLYVLTFSFGYSQPGGSGNVETPRAILIEPDWISEEDMAVQRAMVPLTEGAKSGYFRDQRDYDSLLVWERRGADIDEVEVPAYLDRMSGMLEEYIQQFRIENFTRDVHLIWLSGRIKERKGDTSLAILYYQLAQMHDHGDEIPRLSLDSLLAPTRSDWVTIDEYYQLLDVRSRVDTLKPREVQKPMGENVNSLSPDYAPYMHKSDSVLIFTSRRDTSGMNMDEAVGPDVRQNEDLYYSEYNIWDRGWDIASRFDNQINSEWNEGSACLSPDGRILFFTRCEPLVLGEEYKFRLDRDSTLRIRRPKGYGDCDLYMAEYNPETQQFHKVRNLGGGINSEAWDSQPNVSADGKWLFFSSSRKGGYGGTDLYASRFDSARSTWLPAENLGPLINSAASEVTPFFHQTNQTLYFSSTGHLQNEGSYDIFKTRFLGDRWELPLNVGPLINDKGNQYYFSISGDGKNLYYANAQDLERDHIRQNFDLYSFRLPIEARPDADAILKGVLRDSITGYALRGKAMIIDLEENTPVTPKVLNDSGYFEFTLINDRRYRLYIVGEDFLTINQDFEMQGDTSFSIFTESFEQGKPFVFERLEFKSSSSRLNASLKPNLDYLVRFLNNYPQFQLVIKGHTDSDGDPDKNLKLSQDRADRIRDYLIRKGAIDPDRISAEGYGETEPLVPNDSDENKRKNRRVEFQLIVDESYEGEMYWPSEDEFYYEDNPTREFDPEFDKEFEGWDDLEDIPLDPDPTVLPDPFNAEDEIEKQILEEKKQQAEEEKKKKKTDPKATQKPKGN